MNPLARLHRLLDALPPGGSVTFTREALEALLEAPGDARPDDPSELLVDLRVDDLARLFGRSRSTVRGWIERGDFAGAYRLHGREWRIPADAVRHFQQRQRDGQQPVAGRSARSTGGLSDWRQHIPKRTA